MPHNADAFRYGFLVGLKEAGRTEKVAFGILDDLEETGYDLEKFRARRQEKTAKFMGAVKGLLGGAKGFAQGLTDIGAKAPRAALRANRANVRDAGGIAKGMGFQIPAGQRAASLSRGVPTGFQTGVRANKWLGKHPVAAGAIGAGGVLAGKRMLTGPTASQGDVDQLQQRQGAVEGYLNDPNQRVAEMYQLMQLMRGHPGMGYGY